MSVLIKHGVPPTDPVRLLPGGAVHTERVGQPPRDEAADLRCDLRQGLLLPEDRGRGG